MSNPGLGFGFVKFGTTAHKVLLYIHEHGSVHQSAFKATHPGTTAANYSACIMRLRACGFVFKGPRMHPYDDGVVRPEWTYSFVRSTKPHKQRVVTHSERSKRHRENKRHRVASVFDWRGPITPRQPSSHRGTP